MTKDPGKRDEITQAYTQAARLLPAVEALVEQRRYDVAYLDTLTSIEDLFWNAIQEVVDAANKRRHWSSYWYVYVSDALSIAYFIKHPEFQQLAGLTGTPKGIADDTDDGE